MRRKPAGRDAKLLEQPSQPVLLPVRGHEAAERLADVGVNDRLRGVRGARPERGRGGERLGRDGRRRERRPGAVERLLKATIRGRGRRETARPPTCAAQASPEENERDEEREKFLASEGVEELRFWNHQWRGNREGVLLEIWNALHRRTGCETVMRKVQNHRFLPPKADELIQPPPKPV